MPGRYTQSRNEIRFNLSNPEDITPEMFLSGDPATGWHTSAAPPRQGFWGVTLHDKQIVASSEEPGNLLTWVMNILPGDHRFVSKSAASIYRQQLPTEPVSGWRAMSNILSPVQNVGEMDKVLLFKDEDFDPEEATASWLANPDNATLASLAEREGFDLPGMLRGTRNIHHFQYTQNRVLMMSRAMQNIRQWEKDAGFATSWTSSAVSGVTNYLLTDPTFLPSLFVGGAAIGAAAKSTRFTKPLVTGATAVHTRLAYGLGARAAAAVELGAYGGAYDVASQLDRIRQSQIITDIPELQEDFSWGELGLAVGITGALGYALGGWAGRNHKEVLKATVNHSGGSTASPLSHGIQNMGAQARVDSATVGISRSVDQVVVSNRDLIAPYLDDALLIEAGLSRFHIDDLMEQISFAMKGETVEASVVAQILEDVVTAARRHKESLGKLSGDYPAEFEQAALGRALGRAARELRSDATNEEVLAKARLLVPEELASMEEEMLAQAVQARPASPTEADFWAREAEGIKAAAKYRQLTEAELKYMGTVAGKLQSLGSPNPFIGMASDLSRRYTTGAMFSLLRPIGGSKITRAIQRMAALRHELNELIGARALGEKVDDEIKSVSAKIRGSTRTIKSETKKLKAAAEAPRHTRRVLEIKKAWGEQVPVSRSDKFRAYDQIAAASDFNENAILSDGTFLGSLMKSWGLGGLLRRVGLSGTGQNETTYSSIAVLREVAHEFDASKLRVGDIGQGKQVHRTVEDIRMRVAGISSEMVDFVHRLHIAGKFGPSRKLSKYRQARREFDRAVIKQIRNGGSEDPDVVAFAALFTKRAEEIADLAVATNQFKKTPKFFPRRYNVGAILQSPREFTDALAQFFLRNWTESKDVHLDTLVAMGKARRSLDADGQLVGWTVDGIEEVVTTLKRSELGKVGVTDADYLKAMNTRNADGYSPMELSANRARNNISGDDRYTLTPDGRLAKKGGKLGPLSEADRQIENSVWDDPAMDRFMDWSALEVMTGYFQSTGFRVYNNARHIERWGIPNTTMHDLLDWLLVRVPETATPEEAKAWKDGIKTLREKLLYAEGRLPSLRDQTDPIGEWTGQVGPAAAGAIYSGRIGQAVLSTEAMAQMIGKVYGLDDIVRRVGAIFRAVLPTKDQREQMATLGYTVRHFRSYALERLTGGAIHNEGFQFGVIPKILAPFQDLWDTIGNRVPGHSNTTAAALRAYATTNATIGGMDFFTNFARTLRVQTTLDEVGRFFRAAEKTAKLLEDSIPMLDQVEASAIQAARDRGRSFAQAEAIGRKARFKAWKGLVRQGGFGGNWQVAERMWRAGLLRTDRLAVLREAGTATGALRDTGAGRTVAFNELMDWTSDVRATQDTFEDALEALNVYIRQDIDKRISEQSLMQTPTSQVSRSWLGRTGLAMTSFARSFFDNNILDMAQMPARTAVGLGTVFLIGEIMNRMMSELAQGRSIEEIMADIEQDPDNFVARSLTNLPVLGAWSMLARPAADALTLDGRRSRVNLGGSAAESAVSSITDMVFDSVHGISPLAEDTEIQARTWRTASSFIPGFRSLWGSTITAGLTASGVIDPQGNGRFKRFKKPRVEIPEIVEEYIEFEPGPEFPDDMSFIYPEGE